jgi:hypothetical protein
LRSNEKSGEIAPASSTAAIAAVHVVPSGRSRIGNLVSLPGSVDQPCQ